MSHYLQTVPEPLTGLMLLLGLGGVLRARKHMNR